MSRVLPTLLALLIGLPAVAAPPRFVADAPEDGALARKAWAAGVACTGWAALTHEDVRIVRAERVDGYDGRAWLDADGLYRIEVSGPRPARSLVHEVAHAWTRRGPAALTEGRADLLADCMALRMGAPDLLDPDDGRDLAFLPDLRRWSNPRTRHDDGAFDEHRADAYLGAARLMRVAGTVLPPSALWPRDGVLRWRQLADDLLAAGPKGALIVDVIEGGEARQRQALTDRDQDGMPWLAEILEGTDPERWDSDGDGWWDGAPQASPSAVPLPLDGTAVCSGMASGPAGARVQVRYRAARASTPPAVRVVTGDVWIVDDPARGVAIEPGRPVLLAVDGGQPHAAGGTWALAGGQGLVQAWNCRSTPTWTVWVDDPRAAPDLSTFGDQLAEHLRRADGLLGHAPTRLVVTLGARDTGVNDDGVRLSTGLVAWARDADRLDALAGLAVAMHRTFTGPVEGRRWDTAEALTRALVDAPPPTLFVAVDEEHPAARTSDAGRCGWDAIMAGSCPRAAPDPSARPSGP